ncbi:MAG: hypothetical protein M1830_004057, partial [Pleopsidium flavum]
LLNIMQRTNHNRQIVKGKFQQFWSSLEMWTVQSDAHALIFVPVPLKTQPRDLRMSLFHENPLRDTRYLFRYLLLRLLSGKSIREDSLFDGMILLPYLAEEMWRFLRLKCRNEIDLDLDAFSLKGNAFFDFIDACQDKATGVWTAEQDAAWQSDRTRLTPAERPMRQLLQLLFKEIAKMQWPDEFVGWDKIEDPHKIGKVPGQWVEDRI